MEKPLCFACFFILSMITAKAQPDTLEALVGEEPFSYVEIMPTFKGGQDAMYKFVFDNIEYPPIARENGISGIVIAQFVVDVDSLLKRIHIMRGIGGGCDGEVLRIMHLMNAQKTWIPGKHNGKAVPVIFTLPVKFVLEPAKKKQRKVRE